jgi:hypothetical protein
MFSYTLSLTSALVGCGWKTPRPGRFTRGRDPILIVQEVGCAPGPFWTSAGNLASTAFRPRTFQTVASRYTDVAVAAQLTPTYTHTDRHTHTHLYIYIHTGCPGRNAENFGRVFLMLKYTDINQKTYIQS